MLIVGAKGFAREVLQTLDDLGLVSAQLAFFDDVSADLPERLYGQFSILRTKEQVRDFFEQQGPSFVLGVGSPMLRKALSEKLISWGGELHSAVSPHARLGRFDVSLGSGVAVQANAVIENSVQLGRACLINMGATIGHESIVGPYAEVSPGANVSGRCEIGEGASLGAGAVLLPGVCVGAWSKIGAGAVVLSDVPASATAVGVPARLVVK
jgi:sugar O-acyltransferase (sialic acid O-acetyltransferase NeuD family)